MTGEILIPDPQEGDPKIAGSLRDRKKAQQRQSLIDTASSLFTERGYDNVRMEDIASEAEISTKTVYNYFPSKGDLLIAYMLADRNRTMKTEVQEVLDSISGDLAADIGRMLRADIGIGFAPGDKQLWLEIVAATVRDSSDERFRSIRWMFTGYIERLLSIYRDRKVIPADMDLRPVAHVIHLVYTEAFVDFCAVPERPASEAVAQVIKTLRQVFSRAWFPQM